MGRPRITQCRNCGATVEWGDLSWTKQCPQCGKDRYHANLDQLTEHSGPWFDHWRRRSAAAVGAILIDDVLPPA